METFLNLFMLKRSKSFYMRALIFCALLVALAVISEVLLPAIPLAGLKNGDKVNPASAFMMLAGFMFGPLWGGIAAIVQDLIGCLLKGDAPLPQFMIAPFLTGFLSGFFAFLFKKASKKLWGIALFSTFIATLSFAINSYCIVLTYNLKQGFLAYCLLRLPTLPLKIVLYSAVVYLLYCVVLPRIETKKVRAG